MRGTRARYFKTAHSGLWGGGKEALASLATQFEPVGLANRCGRRNGWL